jgi:hypothetical protein
MRHFNSWTTFAAGLLCCAAYAQDVPAVRTGNTEIGGFTGSSFSTGQARVLGGGNVAYAATRHIMPYGEFSYFPGVVATGQEETIDLGGGSRATFKFRDRLYDFHGGVHLRAPIAESRVVPYGVIGIGGLHYYARREDVRITGPAGSFPLGVSVPSANYFAVNFGGGLRFYVHERFGFRVEAKGYKPSGDLDMFGKITAGFFFQVR